MFTDHPLIDEFARQAGVDAAQLGAVLGRWVRSDGALPVPTASDRSMWDAGSGSIDAATLEAILREAEGERATPWPIPLASSAVRVHRDGDRDSWEQVVFARQARISRAAVAAAVTLEPAWIDELVDGIVLLCEQSSWCWPAHDDTRVRHGAVLASVDDPFLDLGAGEVAGQLAWIDYLLAEQLDSQFPGVRARIALEVQQRVLEPFLRRRDWHWLGLDGNIHNWNPWIHGNVLVAALRFAENAAQRNEIIWLVIEGIDRYVGALPEDGAIDEGFGYWWNGACRALEALELLSFATEGHLDASAVPALVATTAFPHSMHLGADWYVNFADSQAKPATVLPWHALDRAARAANDPAASAHARSHRTAGTPVASAAEGLGRLLRGLTDLEWRDAAEEPSPLPAAVWWPSTEVLVARTLAGSTTGLTLAVKGGHNGENHNHNDVGSFIIASDGTPVVIDAGRPTYTAATFGPDRYSIWTMQSTWHSVPEIRGHAQSTGREFAARSVAESRGASAATLQLDLAAAYEGAGIRSWLRTVTLERDDDPRVVIDDAWSLDPWHEPGLEPPTTLHMLLAGEVDLGEGFARVTPIGGATPITLSWNPEAAATLTSRSLDDPMLTGVWGAAVHRLDVTVTTLGELQVTVRTYSPPSEGRK